MSTGRRLVTAEVEAAVGTTVTYRAPEPLGPASIRYFAMAIGSDPQRWTAVAPPTLICETNQLTGLVTADHNGYLGHTWELPFPEPTTMIRGGNDYQFHAPARPGDVIATTWTLSDVVERADRAGSPLAVATAEATYRRSDGTSLATNSETLLFRPLPPTPSPAPATTPAPRDPATTPPPGSPGSLPTPEGRPTSPTSLTDVGGEVPALVRRLDLVDLVAYGAATWDWHRLHHDQAYAAAAMPGVDRPLVDGQMLGALLAEQVTRAAGAEGRLDRLWFRNRRPVPAGSTVVCRGEVTALDVGRVELGLVVEVDGIVVVDRAGATVRPG